MLTGASGFVGSHVLDSLRCRGFPAVALVRKSSSQKLFAHHRDQIEVREAALDDFPSLRAALRDVTHVIHCAGCTKALRREDFFTVNQLGTRNLLRALPGSIERFVLISSLAAAGPASPGAKVTEVDPPAPISDYGKSKLAAEEEVRNGAVCEYVILRPPAVYGPRDAEFLNLFRSVRRHVLPSPPRQELSLVFVEDLAEAAVQVLNHPACRNQLYYVGHLETVTATDMARQIAAAMNTWTVNLPLPSSLLWAVCCGADVRARITRQAAVLGRQKFPELVAKAWTCNAARLRQDTGFECRTGLADGIRQTLKWYQENGWL